MNHTNTNTQTVLTVSRTWSGDKVPTSQVVWVALERGPEYLDVDIRATHRGDPAPSAPAGRCERLWEHEVVEVFIAGVGDRYLELEFGPHGHYLALTFDGVRELVGDDHTITYVVTSEDSRWRGIARVPIGLLPEGPYRVNAFAMHGHGDDRCHHAVYPGEGEPDFHQLACYEPTPL